MGPGYGGYLDILKSIRLPVSEWEKYCHWNENQYTRNCLSSCEGYELILMCWQKGQQSPIHNYNFQESWIKVLKGDLTIDVFKIDRENRKSTFDYSMIIKENEYTYLNDNMGFHRVKNSSDDSTVSLHLNVEKVNQWEVFQEDKKEFELVKPQYDHLSSDC